MKISSNNITELKENEIFVFGSNLSGIHGAGAAKTALNFGAIFGKGRGIQGNSYALPTKDHYLRVLPIENIRLYVDEFIYIAKENPDYIFLVTEIGCGFAGYEPIDIAPLFKDALDIDNIHLPQRFIEVLYQEKIFDMIQSQSMDNILKIENSKKLLSELENNSQYSISIIDDDICLSKILSDGISNLLIHTDHIAHSFIAYKDSTKKDFLYLIDNKDYKKLYDFFK